MGSTSQIGRLDTFGWLDPIRKKLDPIRKTLQKVRFSEPKSTFSEGVLPEGGPTEGGPTHSPRDDLHGGLKGRNDGPDVRLVSYNSYVTYDVLTFCMFNLSL